ncbi:MAG: carboxypeptidase-like regulatory domain-containing protein, partial [Bryobacteraceae bacterium]
MAVALLLPAAARAQLTGSIEGTVTDPSGRVVAAAQMHVAETATNAERRLATNQQGWYQAAQLVPGHYRLEVTAAGFETAQTEVL